MTSVAAISSVTASAMSARACIRTVLDSGAYGTRTRIAVLRSQAPLSLRPTIGAARRRWSPVSDGLASVALTAAAAGPVGGDELTLEIVVGPGSGLLLTETSATLALPGQDGAPSSRSVRVRIERGGTLIWLPKPVIAVHGCHHVNDVVVDMAADARALIGEQLLMGRKDEESGRVRQEMRVRRDGHSIYVQGLDLGGPLGSGPAVVDHNRAVASLLAIDPALEVSDSTLLAGDGAVLPLAAGGAALVTAMALDDTGVRRQVDQALSVLGPPWSAVRPACGRWD